MRVVLVLLLTLPLFGGCDSFNDEPEYIPGHVTVVINGQPWYASEYLGGFLSGSPESDWSTFFYFTRQDTLADSVRTSEAVLQVSFGEVSADSTWGYIESFSLTERMRSRSTGMLSGGNTPYFTLVPGDGTLRFTISERRLIVAEYPYELFITGSFAADLRIHEESPPSVLGSTLRIEGDLSGVLKQIGPVGIFSIF